MQHLQTKVGHLHTMGHKERYVGSLFRVDEPVPDDSGSMNLSPMILNPLESNNIYIVNLT